MEKAGNWIYLEGWLPFILIILFFTGAICLMAICLSRKTLYGICSVLGVGGILGFLYSLIQLRGTEDGAGIAFYSVACIIGISIGTAFSPFIKQYRSEH
jgi:hypothetical protein